MGMKRILNIALIVAVAALGFTLGRMTGDSLLLPESDEPKTYPLPPAPPQATPAEQMNGVEERGIILEVPTEGATVGSTVTVSGRFDASAFAAIAVTVTDEAGAEIGDVTVWDGPSATEESFERFSESFGVSLAGGAVRRIRIAITGTDATGAVVETVDRLVFAGEKEMLPVAVFLQNADQDQNSDPCSTVYAIPRAVSAETNIYRAAIEELLKGPTEEEASHGYATSLPPRVVLKDIGADANGIVTANFDKTLDRRVAGSCRVGAIRLQIERTLQQFPEVRGVIIEVEGDSDEALQP
jgi:hypothetical protein